MSRGFSDRVRFYLRHRAQIEAWASIAPDADQATNDFFYSLEWPLAKLAKQLPGRPIVFAHVDGLKASVEAPHLLLVHPGWMAPGETRPWVGIGVEWDQASKLDDCFTGVWVNCDGDGFGERLGQKLADSLRITLECSALGEEWPAYEVDPDEDPSWPVYRIETEGLVEDLSDLDGYADVLLNAVCSLWIQVYAIVNQVFEDAMTEGGG